MKEEKMVIFLGVGFLEREIGYRSNPASFEHRAY